MTVFLFRMLSYFFKVKILTLVHLFSNRSSFDVPSLDNVQGVSFGYPGSSPLFHSADFGLTSKSRVVLLGENGNGKTTLVKLMLGELQPTVPYILLHLLGFFLPFFPHIVRKLAHSHARQVCACGTRHPTSVFLSSSVPSFRITSRCTLGGRSADQVGLPSSFGEPAPRRPNRPEPEPPGVHAAAVQGPRGSHRVCAPAKTTVPFGQLRREWRRQLDQCSCRRRSG